MKVSPANSLYLALGTVSLFLVAILIISRPIPTQIASSDNAFAGAVEPTDMIVPPIGGSEELEPTAPPTVRATAISSPTASPSASPTPFPTLEPTPIPTIISDISASPTPVPTFDLNLPGDTTTETPTNPPVAQTQQSNNLPIIIGVIAGILLIVGGLVLVLLRRQSKNEEFVPQAGPTSTPPPTYAPPTAYPNTPGTTADQTQFNTPYDQYVNNQPGNPGNQQNQ